MKKDIRKQRQEKKEKEQQEQLERQKQYEAALIRRQQKERAEQKKKHQFVKKITYLLKIWVKNDSEPWKIGNLTKEHVDEFIRGLAYDGFVVIGNMQAVVNSKELQFVTISKISSDEAG